MSRVRATVALEPIVAAFAGLDDDEVTTAILDATASLLGRFGLRRWSVDDVADAAGLGRTSVYRRFPKRDDLVHAVLARELRDTLAAVGTAAAATGTPEQRISAAAATALGALRGSVVDAWLRVDPATILPFLTVDADRLVALARTTLAVQITAMAPDADPDRAAQVAEVAARLGLSFILTRGTVFPLDHEAAARAALAALVGPLLAMLSAPH